MPHQPIFPPPADLWTRRADWVDAEDGTIVAVAPGYDTSRHSPVPDSATLWPARRSLIAAAPRLRMMLRLMLEHLEGLPAPLQPAAMMEAARAELARIETEAAAGQVAP